MRSKLNTCMFSCLEFCDLHCIFSSDSFLEHSNRLLLCYVHVFLSQSVCSLKFILV